MTGSTIDHLVAMTVFLGAILIFIGLFNQTIQTAILYQRNKYLATKCSDILDNILLNPGTTYNIDNKTVEWGRLDVIPAIFGLQDPEFKQYRLSPFSLMRLESSLGEPVYYPGTRQWYSNITMGFGNFLLVSSAKALNYSTVTKLLGVNNTYGFQLTILPIIRITIEETRAGSPLTINVKVTGMGFPLAHANVSYCLIRVVKDQGEYPKYRTITGNSYTDETGSASLPPFDVTPQESYALIVYARAGGLVGIGYHQRVTEDKRYIIPFVESFEKGLVILTHSYDVHYFGPPESAVFYNATFLQLSEDFTIREVENYKGRIGKVNYGHSIKFEYDNITLPLEPGILVITYKSNNEYGVVLMPWGICSLAFPVVFGEDPMGKNWVATDIRQVLVGKIAYQAKLALWSLEGYQVIG
jgi:hypothetical protein